MKKKIYGIPVLIFLVAILVCVIGIIVGSFFDEQISEAFVDTSDPLGMFVETLGQSFGYALVPIGAVVLCKGLIQYKNVFARIGGVALVVIAGGMATYFLGDSFDVETNEYGYLFETTTAYLVALAVICAETLLSFLLISSKDRRGLVVLGTIIILSFLAQWLIVKLLKSVDCRPRYRYLIDSSFNTTGETFRNWYEFSPFSYSDDFHYSWPSGHSACIAQVFLLPALVPYMRFRYKGQKSVSIVVASALTLFVTIYRVRVGAHFLSDVCFGVLFALVFMLVIMYVTRYCGKRFDRHREKANGDKERLHERLTRNL